jgi:transcriptional regulator with XRE-family HTH domain
MKPPPESEEQEYSPARLLDVLVARLRLKNDAALSRLLGVEAPTISKIRHKRLRVGATMLLRMHEVSNLSIDELRALMGDRRARLRLPGALGHSR